MGKPCTVVVLISGSGSNLQALIDSLAAGDVQRVLFGGKCGNSAR